MRKILRRSGTAAGMLLAALFVLSLYSCPFGVLGDKGSIILSVESTLQEDALDAHESEGKGIAAIPLKIVSWLIEGEGPEGESFVETLSDDSTTTLRQDGLVAGSWTITATGKNSDGTAIVTGSDTILVEKGAITYAGISCAGVQGTGSLSVQITWPVLSIKQPDIQAYVSVSDILSPSRDLDFPIIITGASAAGTLAGIPSGPIMLEIFIGDDFGEGKTVWTGMDVVHIVAGETISGTWTLVANEIDSIGQGDVDINVVADIPQPVDVGLTLKGTASSDAGSIFTVAGTSNPGAETYTLFLDSEFYREGYSLPADWAVGPGLSPGPHFLTLVCRNGLNYGSATFKIIQMAEGIQVGAVLAWGHSNILTRIDGDDSPVPVQALGLPQGIPRLVDAGAYHAMAVTADGELWTWGMNNGYQCGHNTYENVAWKPGRPLPDVPVSLIAAGVWHSLAYTEAYGLAAWGQNSRGQLGVGDRLARREPFLVKGAVEDQALVDIAAGEHHSLAVGQDGTAYAWGLNESGELGDGTLLDRLSSVKVTAPAGLAFSQVEISGDASFGLSSTGAVYGWGSNGMLKVNNSTTERFLLPTKIPLSDTRVFTDIAILGSGGYARASDGTVWRWGGFTDWLTQIPSPAGTTIVELDGMEETLLGCGADGKLYTLGDNMFCALGDGKREYHYAERWTLVQGLSGKDIRAISMGGFGGLAAIAW